MRSIFNRRCAEAGRSRVRVIAGIALWVTLAGIGGRQLFATAEPTTHVVVMADMTFSPAVLRVRVGDRIEFRNNDLFPHTATAQNAAAFDSGIVEPRKSWILVPKEPGTFDYTCTLHPVMKGRLTVDGT